VQQYLSENINLGNSIRFVSSGDQQKPAFIKEVLLESDSGVSSGLFDVDSLLKLSIKVCVKEPIAGTTPYFDLKHNGNVLYRSFASDCCEDILKGMDPGDYVFSSMLHSPLKKGRYSIDVRLNKIAVQFYDDYSDIISFETDELKADLQNKSYWHKRPGVMGFIKPWEIKQESKKAES
jgi:hypothetical protein